MNFRILLNCRILFLIVCASTSIQLLNSDSTFAQEEIKSQEVAKLLKEVVENYPDSNSQPSHEAQMMNSRLMRMLFNNGQYELAERFVDSRKGYHQKELHGKLFTEHMKRVTRIAETGPVDPNYLNAVKSIASKGSVVMANPTKHIEGLLATGQIEIAEQIIMSLPGDLKSYEYRSGMINNGMKKMHLVARLIKFELIRGDEAKARELLDEFGKDVSREQAKLSVMANCYATEPIHNDLAEEVYDWIEDPAKKFWAAYRLGTQFSKEENVEKTLEYARLMNEHYEHGSLKKYFGKFLLNLIQLQFNKGQSAEWAIGKFEQAPTDKRDKLFFLIVLAMEGDMQRLSGRLDLVLSAVTYLTNFENNARSGLSSSPFRFVDSEKRLATAIELVDLLENPYLKAQCLCKISAELIPRELHPKGGTMGIGRVTEKSLKVMDLDKAVQLADRAFAEANVEAKPFVVSKYLTLDQSNSMQEIASLYMKLGRLSQATKAIEKISDRFVKDRDGKESPIPENDQFLRRYASGVTTKDEPFIEDGGREVFAYIEMLAEYPRGTSYPGLTRITSKFASLGHWDRAEKAFDMANEFYDEPFYVPSALVEEIAASNDVNRLRKWQKKCSPKSMGAFLEAYCRYCNNKRKLPSRDILIEFDLIRESMDSHQQCRDLDTMLLIGFWVDGMDEYVDKQFNRLGKKREVYLPAVARRAASFGFPKLAVKVAEKIKDKKSREETLLSFHRFKASGEFESEATPDENWLKKQPVAVKASLKMQQAKQILDAMEK